MSSFTLLLLCIQACLIQNVFSQAVYGLPGYGFNAGSAAYSNLDVEVDAVSYGAAGLSGYGLGNNVGLGGVNLGGANLGLGLGGANLGVGLGGANLGLGLGGANFGVGLGSANLGLGLGNAGFVSGGLSGYGGISDVAAVAALPVAGPYGGVGYAELAVGGEIGASGSTVVAGQIPVLGAVSFNGGIPASGVVSIAGNCGCAGVPL